VKASLSGEIHIIEIDTAADAHGIRPGDRDDHTLLALYPGRPGAIVEAQPQIHGDFDCAFEPVDDTDQLMRSAYRRQRHEVEYHGLAGASLDGGFEDHCVREVASGYARG
jgi:hypothetical protein